jgi:hypothetical protein
MASSNLVFGITLTALVSRYATVLQTNRAPHHLQATLYSEAARLDKIQQMNLRIYCSQLICSKLHQSYQPYTYVSAAQHASLSAALPPQTQRAIKASWFVN